MRSCYENHGPVVTGKTIEEAVVGIIMLENAAQIDLLVEAAGTPAPEFPSDDIAKFKNEIGQPEQFKINFHYLARRVKRRKAQLCEARQAGPPTAWKTLRRDGYLVKDRTRRRPGRASRR